MSQTRIDLHVETAQVIVAVIGDVDLASSQELGKTLHAAIDMAAERIVVVDLSQTAFLDSTGIGALMNAYRTASQRHVPLTVVGATGLVHQVLTITGVLATLAGERQVT